MNKRLLTGRQPDSGKPTVRDERGACGNVGYGRAKRVRTAETPTQPSPSLRLRAPYFYPTPPSALASSKAGVTGMTLVAAGDLAQRAIRICTIAPGVFDTPIMARRPAHVKTLPGAAVPHPPPPSQTDEFAALALHIRENPMLNGETIRLDGALRMGRPDEPFAMAAT